MTEHSLDEAEWIPWLRLSMAAGIGKVRARRLLDAFGSPDGVFAERASELVARAEIPPSAAERLVSPDNVQEAQNELARVRALGVRLMHLGSPDYPELLREMHFPPILLGRLGADANPGRRAVAIVGSRHAGARALRVAYEFGRAIAAEGIAVVSGLALGVDRAAHEGALAAPDGRTIAVMGCGLARVYPAQHARLAARIRERGALVSELAADAAPRAEHFPMRNRIIAGMSLATIVIAAGKRSGALITARQAVEECESAREVFAVPGSIDDSLSHGTNSLIKKGEAHLIESPEEFLTHPSVGFKQPRPDGPLGPEDPGRVLPDRGPREPLAGVPGEIVRYLEGRGGICTFDEIVFENRIDARAAMSALGFLAIRRRVREVPGAGYVAVG